MSLPDLSLPNVDANLFDAWPGARLTGASGSQSFNAGKQLRVNQRAI